MRESWPKISVLMATLNAAAVIENAFKSIREQDYPQEKIEIIIGDGGSTDGTRELASKYNVKIVHNKLKTGEAGKMIALKASTGDFIALVDSDNILIDKTWFKDMIAPLLNHPEAVGSEPWEYTWRKQDSFITRYSALIGMNDPLVYFLGNYDRLCLLSGKWTETEHTEKDFGKYLLLTFDSRGLPTIGANGTVFRTEFLKDNVVGDYLFDIDILSAYIQKRGSVQFIKTKNGIVHTFCEGNIFKFARKQRRRVKDFLFHKWVAQDRNFDWYEKDIFGRDPWGLIKFILYCVTIVPLLIQSVRGYVKKPDSAWFFHPLACEITLWEYGWGRLFSLVKKTELDRSSWKQ